MSASYVEEKRREIEELLREPVLAFDFETTGLSPYRGSAIFALAIAGANKEWYFNFNEILSDAPCIPNEERIGILRSIFDSDDRIWLAHNAKFDLAFLKVIGIQPKGVIWDTNVMARVEYNDHFDYSLESCGERIGVPKDDTVKKYMDKNKLYSIIQIPGKKKRDKDYKFFMVPTEIMEKYAKQDARVCYELFKKQRGTFGAWDISKRPISPIVELEQATTITLLEMEAEGIKVDLDYCKRAVEFYTEEMNKASLEYCKIAEIPHNLFVDSGKFHQETYNKLGYKVQKTKKGNASFTEETLDPVERPIDKYILEYREASKKIGTFFSSYLYFADNKGKIHPNIKQAGTVAGRFSCSSPNLQQISRDDDINTPFPVRRAFIAEEGFQLLSIDYKAMEYRVMLDFAKCIPVIRKIMDEGMDLHEATAALMGHGISRQHAKTLGFCIAEDSLVLTDSGLIKIQEVTKSMKVWDGNEFVSHDGVMYQGEKEVMEYDGLTATPDHEVYTNKGRKIRFDVASSEQDDERILVTEIDGIPIRDSESITRDTRERWKTCKNKGILQSLRKDIKRTYDIINAGPRHRFTVSGKLVSNCLLYGGGSGKVAEMLYISVPEADVLKAKYFLNLPEVQELIYGNKYTGKKGIIDIANERGFIVNKFGRRYHFPYRWVTFEDPEWEGDPKDPKRFRKEWVNFSYKAPNYLIQGTCSDVLRRAMVAIRKFLLEGGYKTRMLVPIHDELVFKLANDEHHIIPELKRLMREAYPHDLLPLDGSAEIGANLYDMEKVA